MIPPEQCRRKYEGASCVCVALDGKISYASEALCQMLGYSVEELRGLDYRHVTPERWQSCEERIIEKVLQGNFSRAYKKEFMTKDGTIVPVEVQSFLSRDEMNNPDGYCTVVGDVPDCKKEDRALENSLRDMSTVFALNREILGTSSIGIRLYKESGKCVFANRAAATQVGEELEDLLSLNLHDIRAWKEHGLYDAALQTLSTQQEQGREAHFISLFGKEVWLSARFSSFLVKGEKYALVFSSDISELKRLENQNLELLVKAREDRDLLFTLIDSITDEVWFIDSERRITIANKSAKREFLLDDTGTPPDVEDFVRNLVILRGDGSVRPPEEAPVLRALAGEVVVGEEEAVRVPSKRRLLRIRQVSAAPVKNGSGEIIGAVAVVRDITETKRIEGAIRESRAVLKRQTELIGEKNIALRELLGQVTTEKEMFHQNMMANVAHLIMPLVRKFTPNAVSSEEIALLSTYLNDLTATFGRKISDRQYMLTPKEIEVCAFIRIGLSNKEIASRLFLSVETVEKHRKNIRRKLGLVGKGINLQTHLTDFQ